MASESKKHEAAEHHGEHEPHEHPPYMTLFFVLGALTVVELALAYLLPHGAMLRVILVSMSSVKAVLVAMYYMHLKFERLAMVLVACSPLAFAMILMCGLYWDIVLYQR